VLPHLGSPLHLIVITMVFFGSGLGLRQGVPISPLLFVIVMDYLSRALKIAAQSLDFKFHPLCKSVSLAHLCFGDDLLLFCKADCGSVACLMAAFQHFSECTRLEANLESQIIMAGINEVLKKHLLELTGFQEGLSCHSSAQGYL